MSPDDPSGLIRAIGRRLTWQDWVANAVGAAVVFMAIGFLLTIFFDQAESDRLGRENLLPVVAFVLVAGVLSRSLLRRRLRSALAWVREAREAREPTADEHRATLRLPAFLALVTTAGWGLGGLFFALVNVDHSAGAVASIWLGGETASALVYLISERTLRPVTALALSAREADGSAAPGVRYRMLFAWSLGTGVPMLGVLVVGVADLAKQGVDPQDLALAGVFLGAVAIAASMLFNEITARAIADSLTAMRRAMERVGGGDLEAVVAVDDASEVGLMQAEFNRMAAGLRERER